MLEVVGVVLVLALLAQMPWAAWRRRLAIVSEVRVSGLRYLDSDHVAGAAGLAVGQDLFRLDLARARQALLLDPRIASAQVTHRWPRGITIRVVERVPVLLVRHGVPWEIDAQGVLLPPLQRGVVADVPLLTGPSFDATTGGTQVGGVQVQRGLAWVAALSSRELQLASEVSEVDVADPATTGLILLEGTRVLAPPFPPDVRRLSALRVVLADLKKRGTTASEVDLRYENQVIVRPVAVAEGPPSG
jgi:cell division septal protein FtsQ